MTRNLLFVLLLIGSPLLLQAQEVKVIDGFNKELLPGVSFFTGSDLVGISNENGIVQLDPIYIGDTLTAFLSGFRHQRIIPKFGTQKLKLFSFYQTLDQVEIKGKEKNNFGFKRLRPVEGVFIYAGKKTEVIQAQNLPANLATNNARQVFAKVSGLNIWESDCAGLQLGIGGRGLSPNRTTHFNTRQNHYDISADALGYPESYYSPPLQAIDRVEVVRGAAGLQYGPQLGGLVNFILKDENQSNKGKGSVQLGLGSYKFLNVFVDYGKKSGRWTYYGYLQRKQGDCFRPNSGFALWSGHAYAKYAWAEHNFISFESTHLSYLAQQAGGLTDQAFLEDPTQSTRERNWFQVKWNLFALKAGKQWDNGWRFQTSTFGLIASREALGFLGPINRPDPNGERDIIAGEFKNIGNETRFLKQFNLPKGIASLALGTRIYQGLNLAYQGMGSAGKEADFARKDNGLKSDYRYPNQNLAAFAEFILPVHEKVKVTPGFRAEYINTQAQGVLRNVVEDLAGDTILDRTVADRLKKQRGVFLGGLGVSYQHSESVEWYSNFSTNYRPVNFTDLKIVNPSFEVDSNLSDEKGYNIDLGLKWEKPKNFALDFSLFYLGYKNRIGEILALSGTTNQLVRRRSNISASRNVGFESYFEKSVWSTETSGITLFQNTAYINAIYLDSDNGILDGNKVELVPDWNIKLGGSWNYRQWKLSGQWGYVSEQFSDATNSLETPSAIFGLIPSYSVLDISLQFASKSWKISANLDNALDQSYFTRRATGYPGPGIIPSATRQLFLNLSYQF